MEFVKKIADNFVFKLMKFPETEPHNAPNPRIIEQFLVSHHRDSLQITLIEKTNRHSRE